MRRPFPASLPRSLLDGVTPAAPAALAGQPAHRDPHPDRPAGPDRRPARPRRRDADHRCHVGLGVKASFRNYVVGPIAHGSIEIAGGVTRNADGTFRFPAGTGTYDDAGRLTEIAFTGRVSFLGHAGALELHLDDPRIDLNGDQSVLRADMTSKDMTSGQVVVYDDVAVAHLDAQAGTHIADAGRSSWRGIPATLTAAGAPAFAGFYAAGSDIDPVALDYDGPGGKPVVTAETWDAEAQPTFAMTSTDLTGFGAPGQPSYDAANDRIWIPSYGAHEVRALDAETLATELTVAVPAQNPRGVTYSAVDDRAYVVDTGLTVLAPGSAGGAWAIEQTLPGPSPFGASNDVAVDPVTGDAWLSWVHDVPTVRIFSRGQDGTYTHRDLTLPADFRPGKVLFAGDGSAVITAETNGFSSVGAYRVVGEPGAERFQPVPGATSVPGYRLLDDDSLVVVLPDYTLYPVVTTSIERWELTDTGYVAAEPVLASAPDISGSAVASFSPDGSVVVGASLNYRNLRILVDRVASEPRDMGATMAGSLALPDGTVVVLTSNAKAHRLTLQGKAPSFDARPADATTELATGEASAPATFTAAASTGSTLRWQRRAPGANRFSDVADATTGSLTLPASIAADGTQVRVVATNEYGEVASPSATLTVLAAPTVVSAPRSVTVTEGTPAVFTTSFTGLPTPALVWERQVGGFWEPIAEDDENFVLDEGSLMVPETVVAQSGTRLRARVRNDSGTVRTAAVTLSVQPRVTIGPEGLDLDGVSLEWTGSEELQAAPPFGGSNYFSAGVSAGDQATYRAAEGDVSVVHVAPGGAETAATWATRAAQADGSRTQLVRLDGGDASLRADGSAVVTWDGAFSVNFYGGLVPFTLSDPELRVGADGTGTLVADLAGYASDMADPEVREPLAPVADVTVATFAGVEIDPAGRVTVTPDYAGVQLAVPAGQTPQDRQVAGWGSWPQAFVDFHFATGLSSYWYTSGGGADPKKSAAPFVVDLTDAVPAPADAASTTTLTLDRASVRYGDRASATVRVAAGGAAATGRVRVTVAGRSVVATLADGAARVELPRGTEPGRHAVTASYDGGAGVRASAGSADLRVAKARPAVRLRLAKATARPGQRVRATVVVRIGEGATVRPQGTVVLRDGSRVVARLPLRATDRGTVAVRLPALAAGRHVLRATLRGSDLQVARSSATRTLRVR